MFTLKSAAILALLGSAFAAPLAHRDTDDTPEFGRYGNNVISVTPTVDDAGNDATKIVYVVPADGSDDDSNSQVQTHYGFGHGSGNNGGSSSTPTVTSTGSTDTGSTGTGSSTDASASGSTGTGSGGDWLTIANKWRVAGGNAAFKESSKLVANAQKTAQDGNGQMVHELNPGTYGQVLAPGTESNFESVYVGGWLCERPNLQGLNGICTSMTKGWSHDGETGHADILTDPKYTSLGCALVDNIWACDVA